MNEIESLTPQEELLARALKAWEQAKILHLTASWNSQPAAVFFAEKLSLRADCESGLIGMLEDPNQLVAAYSLETLFRMNSPVFSELPSMLLERKEKITILTGSFSNEMELKAYAMHLRKKWMSKNKDPKQ